MSRGPFPGREDDGDEEDYTELLRAAYEKLEPDLRSRKALLVNKRVGSKVWRPALPMSLSGCGHCSSIVSEHQQGGGSCSLSTVLSRRLHRAGLLARLHSP